MSEPRREPEPAPKRRKRKRRAAIVAPPAFQSLVPGARSEVFGHLFHPALGWCGGLILAIAIVLHFMSGGPPDRSISSFVLKALLPVLILPLGGALAAAWLSSRAGVVVGPDGVRMGRRFIPHARILKVRHQWEYHEATQSYEQAAYEVPEDRWHVYLDLNDGEVVDVVTTRYGRAVAAIHLPATQDHAGEQLARSIEEARAAWVAGRRSADRGGDALERGGRTGAEWLRALRRIGSSKTAVYRGAPLDAARLSRLLDDPAASPSARAAAAIVLAASGDPTTAPRLRVGAGALASPKTRIALERLADAPDDEAVAEALEVLAALESLDEADREHRA